ncbi:uncharacterized protein METZ01_LOCUS271446, partial [marine metagenome]
SSVNYRFKFVYRFNNKVSQGGSNSTK